MLVKRESPRQAANLTAQRLFDIFPQGAVIQERKELGDALSAGQLFLGDGPQCLITQKGQHGRNILTAEHFGKSHLAQLFLPGKGEDQ